MDNNPRKPPVRRGIQTVEVSSAQALIDNHLKGRRGPVPVSSMASRAPPPSATNRPPGATKAPAFANVSVPARSHAKEDCHNPQCTHCGSVIIPSPQSSLPIRDQPSISVKDWSIYTIKRPILSSAELDALESRFDFPLPEMIFGNNYVKLVHDPSSKQIVFNALDALDTLESSCELKVAYHEEWLSSRKKMNEDILKPYDWTYSTNYGGNSDFDWQDTEEELPIAKLLQPDPILFFDESILFEDELGDNGISMLSTKIRVMPTCLLLLCRLFLRIDDVIFRIRDTRVYVDFDTNRILRELKYQELDYPSVLAMTAKTSDPKKLLRDANWVSQKLPVISCRRQVASPE